MKRKKLLKIIQKLIIFLSFLLILINLVTHNYYIALLWGLIMLKDWNALSTMDILDLKDDLIDRQMGLLENYRMIIKTAMEAANNEKV